MGLALEAGVANTGHWQGDGMATTWEVRAGSISGLLAASRVRGSPGGNLLLPAVHPWMGPRACGLRCAASASAQESHGPAQPQFRLSSSQRRSTMQPASAPLSAPQQSPRPSPSRTPVQAPLSAEQQQRFHVEHSPQAAGSSVPRELELRADAPQNARPAWDVQ